MAAGWTVGLWTLVVVVLLGVAAGPAAAALVVYEGFSTTTGGVASPDLAEIGICAHRGASYTHPENTLASFGEAVRLGAHQIELDVRMTSDGQMVLMHDATVDRTTDGEGAVSSLTLAQIKALDAGFWKGSAFVGERVPTLAEALEIMPQNVWVNIHVYGDATFGAAAAREVLRQDRTHQAFLACSTGVIDAARAAVPEIMICNMNRLDGGTLYVNDTINRGCDFIQFVDHLASSADMARLSDAGVRVNFTSTNSPGDLPGLYGGGANFPLVDNVGLMVGAAAALGIPPLAPITALPRPRVRTTTWRTRRFAGRIANASGWRDRGRRPAVSTRTWISTRGRRG